MLTFIELIPFSRVREDYLDDEDFRALQNHMDVNPEAGDVIPGSGGCRKLRWSVKGRGKRGGLRVIYFLRLTHGAIVLVTLYAKNVRENIEATTLMALKEAFDHDQIKRKSAR